MNSSCLFLGTVVHLMIVFFFLAPTYFFSKKAVGRLLGAQRQGSLLITKETMLLPLERLTHYKLSPERQGMPQGEC